MKRFLSPALSLVSFAFLLLATDRHAWAYADPGSGLFLLQGFASVGAAITYFLRRRILALFGRDKPAPKADDPRKSE